MKIVINHNESIEIQINAVQEWYSKKFPNDVYFKRSLLSNINSNDPKESLLEVFYNDYMNKESLSINDYKKCLIDLLKNNSIK